MLYHFCSHCPKFFETATQLKEHSRVRHRQGHLFDKIDCRDINHKVQSRARNDNKSIKRQLNANEDGDKSPPSAYSTITHERKFGECLSDCRSLLERVRHYQLASSEGRLRFNTCEEYEEEDGDVVEVDNLAQDSDTKPEAAAAARLERYLSRLNGEIARQLSIRGVATVSSFTDRRQRATTAAAAVNSTASKSSSTNQQQQQRDSTTPDVSSELPSTTSTTTNVVDNKSKDYLQQCQSAGATNNNRAPNPQQLLEVKFHKQQRRRAVEPTDVIEKLNGPKLDNERQQQQQQQQQLEQRHHDEGCRIVDSQDEVGEGECTSCASGPVVGRGINLCSTNSEAGRPHRRREIKSDDDDDDYDDQHKDQEAKVQTLAQEVLLPLERLAVNDNLKLDKTPSSASSRRKRAPRRIYNSSWSRTRSKSWPPPPPSFFEIDRAVESEVFGHSATVGGELQLTSSCGLCNHKQQIIVIEKKAHVRGSGGLDAATCQCRICTTGRGATLADLEVKLAAGVGRGYRSGSIDLLPLESGASQTNQFISIDWQWKQNRLEDEEQLLVRKCLQLSGQQKLIERQPAAIDGTNQALPNGSHSSKAANSQASQEGRWPAACNQQQLISSRQPKVSGDSQADVESLPVSLQRQLGQSESAALTEDKEEEATAESEVKATKFIGSSRGREGNLRNLTKLTNVVSETNSMAIDDVLVLRCACNLAKRLQPANCPDVRLTNDPKLNSGHDFRAERQVCVIHFAQPKLLSSLPAFSQTSEGVEGKSTAAAAVADPQQAANPRSISNLSGCELMDDGGGGGPCWSTSEFVGHFTSQGKKNDGVGGSLPEEMLQVHVTLRDSLASRTWNVEQKIGHDQVGLGQSAEFVAANLVAPTAQAAFGGDGRATKPTDSSAAQFASSTTTAQLDRRALALGFGLALRLLSAATYSSQAAKDLTSQTPPPPPPLLLLPSGLDETSGDKSSGRCEKVPATPVACQSSATTTSVADGKQTTSTLVKPPPAGVTKDQATSGDELEDEVAAAAAVAATSAGFETETDWRSQSGFRDRVRCSRLATGGQVEWETTRKLEATKGQEKPTSASHVGDNVAVALLLAENKPFEFDGNGGDDGKWRLGGNNDAAAAANVVVEQSPTLGQQHDKPAGHKEETGLQCDDLLSKQVDLECERAPGSQLCHDKHAAAALPLPLPLPPHQVEATRVADNQGPGALMAVSRKTLGNQFGLSSVLMSATTHAHCVGIGGQRMALAQDQDEQQGGHKLPLSSGDDHKANGDQNKASKPFSASDQLEEEAALVVARGQQTGHLPAANTSSQPNGAQGAPTWNNGGQNDNESEAKPLASFTSSWKDDGKEEEEAALASSKELAPIADGGPPPSSQRQPYEQQQQQLQEAAQILEADELRPTKQLVGRKNEQEDGQFERHADDIAPATPPRPPPLKSILKLRPTGSGEFPLVSSGFGGQPVSTNRSSVTTTNSNQTNDKPDGFNSPPPPSQPPPPLSETNNDGSTKLVVSSAELMVNEAKLDTANLDLRGGGVLPLATRRRSLVRFNDIVQQQPIEARESPDYLDEQSGDCCSSSSSSSDWLDNEAHEAEQSDVA